MKPRNTKEARAMAEHEEGKAKGLAEKWENNHPANRTETIQIGVADGYLIIDGEITDTEAYWNKEGLWIVKNGEDKLIFERNTIENHADDS